VGLGVGVWMSQIKLPHFAFEIVADSLFGTNGAQLAVSGDCYFRYIDGVLAVAEQ